jgi:deoxyribose-phosphate aldolase
MVDDRDKHAPSLPMGSVAFMTALVAHDDSSDRVRTITAGAMRIPAVDSVGLEARAAALTGRSVKKATKMAALRLAVVCMDLTTLEGVDTPGKVRALCTKAMHPDPTDPSVPAVAAVCVYPELVATARAALGTSGVKVASVAGTFPAGLGPLPTRLDEIRRAVDAGADEIDIVLNRSAFLAGDLARAFDDIVASKQACGTAHLKVILETGELGTYDNVRRASMLAMAAGADFIKTSTGKIGINATPPFALVMCEAIRDHFEQTGERVGLKLAGGIRTAKQSWQYLVIVNETLGGDWLTPDLFRLGASSLLNDVLMQLRTQSTGRYQRPDDFTVD